MKCILRICSYLWVFVDFPYFFHMKNSVAHGQTSAPLKINWKSELSGLGKVLKNSIFLYKIILTNRIFKRIILTNRIIKRIILSNRIFKRIILSNRIYSIEQKKIFINLNWQNIFIKNSTDHSVIYYFMGGHVFWPNLDHVQP